MSEITSSKLSFSLCIKSGLHPPHYISDQLDEVPSFERAAGTLKPDGQGIWEENFWDKEIITVLDEHTEAGIAETFRFVKRHREQLVGLAAAGSWFAYLSIRISKAAYHVGVFLDTDFVSMLQSSMLQLEFDVYTID